MGELSESTQNDPAEISTGSPIRALAFTADGKHLVSGDKETVRMWRVADNQQVGATKAKDVRSIAVSKDGRWIAAGKSWGEMSVWRLQTQTFEEVLKHNSDGHTVTSVDFSPDSTRLVAASGNRKAYVWDIASRRMVVGPLEHKYWVVAAKFSPRGDLVATATFRRDSVRVYDSRNGSLIADISAKVSPYYNTGLLWSKRDILILSNKSINRIDVSAGSVALEWPVDDGNYPCIVSPESGEFVLYSAGYEITKFYNTRTSTQQRNPIQPPQDRDAHSIALSPDGQYLASGGGDGKLVIQNLVTAGDRCSHEVLSTTM